MNEHNSYSGAPGTDDSLQIGASIAEMVSSGPMLARINHFLAAMNAGGEDADEKYRVALEELRKYPDEIIVAIAQIEACGEHEYPLRWGLVYAATQMNHDAALPFLRHIVLTPIPPERSRTPHSYSTVGQETVLRTTAVEGVGRLAAMGNERALQSLFDFLSLASISIRRASVQAILAVDEQLRDRIAEYLPPEQRFLLDIKPQVVTDVPQVQSPERHLRDQEPQSKPSPPGLAESGRRTRKRKNSPKVGG